ncbi:hypothetical protein T08_15322 [Trichinella sp. T8]|nr:hypothetical protein T08_15322 [Trichinella sp. T8]
MEDSAMKRFKESVSYDGSRNFVGLLWRPDSASLSDSKKAARLKAHLEHELCLPLYCSTC